MGIIKQIGSIAVPLVLAVAINSCSNAGITTQPVPVQKQNIIPENYIVDLGGSARGIKTGKSITIGLNYSSSGFGIKGLVPVSPAFVKNIRGYKVSLCTDPNSPLSTAISSPIMVSRDGSALPPPHTITFTNVPVGGPYFAVVGALDTNGNNITESNNGGAVYSGNPGARAAVSTNSVTVNPDLTLSPPATTLMVTLNLLSSKPGTDDFAVSPPNSFTYGKPAVSTSVMGRGLLVWSDNRNGNFDIMARRVWGFNPIGNDFQLNLNINANEQIDPAVSLDISGNGIVVWTSLDNGTNHQVYGLKIVNYSPSGTEFPIADINASEQQRPSVAVDASGNGMVTWTDKRSGDFDIYAKKLVNYLPSGTDFRIDQATKGNQYYSDISLNASGNGVITWIDDRTTSTGIFTRQIVNYGVIVNEIGPISSNVYPHVSINLNAAGDGLITWSVASKVLANKVTTFVPTGIPFQVSDATGATKLHPEVLLDASTGQGMISWEDLREGGLLRIYARKIVSFAPPGGSTDTRVTTSPDASVQEYPAIALNGGGNGFITWTDTRSFLNSIQIRHIINLTPF